MDVVISIIAILAGLIGIAGSIIPGIPGPPVGWVGMLVLYIWGGNVFGKDMPTWLLILMFIVMAVVTVLDFIVPAKMTKVTGGGNAGSKGALIGMIAGMFLTPIGMLLGCFLGALIGEYVFAKKDVMPSLKAAIGSFIGVITGIGLKLVCTGITMWLIIVYL